MIVKMKFINISGPRNDIDRVTDLYLSRYEIQLESALSELKTVDNLRPFVEINPYKDALGKAEEFAGYLVNADEISPDTSLGPVSYTHLDVYKRQVGIAVFGFLIAVSVLFISISLPWVSHR